MTSERINVTYRVTTPLFCGGAGGDTAEVRLPSFKGVLRWWWRALAWSRLGGDLDKVQHEENALFGSASGGQSKVVMRLIPHRAGHRQPSMIPKDEVLKWRNNVVGDGARYLGYGVMEAYDNEKKNLRKGQLKRPCLEAPFEFELELRTRNLDALNRELLLDTLRTVGLLGGFGAKSRKGYGSLALGSLAIDGKSTWAPPTSTEALKNAIAALLPTAANAVALPPYTALSRLTRIILFPARGQAALDLLDRIGREMMRYRSWGHKGIVLREPSEKNFQDDHDLMRRERPGRRRKHPRRIVFGLPHNYGKNEGDKVGPSDDEDGDRRASPLLIHIHQCNETPVAVLSFLPARFLSKGDAAKINVGGDHIRIAPNTELWQPIDDFLDRFLDPSRRELSSNAVELRP